MAEKEATMYVVDVGRSMGERHGGRSESDLQWAMQYVWDKITSTVMTGRKTALVGVLSFRSDVTNHELEDGEGYDNINVLVELGQMLMPGIRDIRDKIVPSEGDVGDVMSALIIAIQMIRNHCKRLKYVRRIILVTNATGEMHADDIEEVASKIREEGIEIVVLGVDFDDDEYGFKEEGKSDVKRTNEAILKGLVEQCDGVYGTLAQAIGELGMPRIKSVRPMPSYRGQLMLGNPETYDTAFTIDVERYPRVMVAKPPTASSFVLKSGAGQDSTQSSATLQGVERGLLSDPSRSEEGLAAVRSSRTYQVTDESAPGGKRDVEMEELAKGYGYGRTAVHISESEGNIVNLETTAGLEIVGFVPAENFDRYLGMSRSNIIIPQKANDKSVMALSSLIHALYELDSYAVARFVIKDGKPPVLLLLAPSIEPDYECLIDVELPFAEDMRNYRFPPLDKVVTVSGKTLVEHRNLPSDALQQAMSDYVDSMDLCPNEGSEEEANDYIPMDEAFSPVLHRISQAIRFRAVSPNSPLPPPYPILTRFSHPPSSLTKQSQPHLDRILTTADVKKVPPRQKGRKRVRDDQKPLSGLNVGELLGGDEKVRRRRKLDPHNAIPEFKQLLATCDDLAVVADAVRQLSGFILNAVRNSVGDSGYGHALEMMRVMREEMIELEEPDRYNEFLRGLKSKVAAEALGGDRREFWWEVRGKRMGLVDKRGSEFSDVSEAEAREFLALKSS